MEYFKVLVISTTFKKNPFNYACREGDSKLIKIFAKHEKIVIRGVCISIKDNFSRMTLVM